MMLCVCALLTQSRPYAVGFFEAGTSKTAQK